MKDKQICNAYLSKKNEIKTQNKLPNIRQLLEAVGFLNKNDPKIQVWSEWSHIVIDDYLIFCCGHIQFNVQQKQKNTY